MGDDGDVTPANSSRFFHPMVLHNLSPGSDGSWWPEKQGGPERHRSPSATEARATWLSERPGEQRGHSTCVTSDPYQ